MSDLSDFLGGGIDVAENYTEESSFQLLPDIKGAVLGITNHDMVKKEENGSVTWQALKLEYTVMSDGEWGGQYVGKNGSHLFTLINTDHPERVQWSKDELVRWAYGCGIPVLTKEEEFVGKRFITDIARDKTGKYQKYYSIKPVGVAQPAMTQPAQQSAQQPSAQPAFNAQQGAPTNPFAK